MALSRIRANVTVTSPTAAVTVSPEGVVWATVGVVQTAATVVIPISAISWINIIYSAEVDYRGMNPVVKEISVVADTNAFHLFKPFAEAQSTVEQATRFVGKALADAPTLSEITVYSLQRTINELVDATDDFYGVANSDDDQTMFFSKSIPTETQTVSDTDNWALTKAATEGLNTTESTTYAATKALADNPSISEAVGYTYQKAVADTADAGDELNALFVTDDGQTMFMSKNFSEPLSNSDAAVTAFGKNPNDYLYTSDYLQPFDFGKGLTENPVTSQQVTYTFGTSRVDTSTVTDNSVYSYGRPEYDSVNAQREGPNFWDNYVDPTYMGAGYAGTGIPAFDVEKAVSDAASNSDTLTYTMVYSRTLSDSVNATDDFDGTATTEDDQTMTFAKGLSDTISHSDAHAFVVGMSREDAATFSDALTDLFGKAVTDSFTKSDLVTASVGKALADSATTSDNITARSFSKALSDLVDATDDFDGAATAEDDQTMSFVTSRAETVSASDSSSQSAGKGLTDSVSTGDSGSLRMTDYCDVLYFTDVYVGISATF
jgi:hypothetical protein